MDEYEDYDPLAGFTAAQKRRVMAMKETQAKYDLVNKDYQKELAQLQAKYQTQYGESKCLNNSLKLHVPLCQIPISEHVADLSPCTSVM